MKLFFTFIKNKMDKIITNRNISMAEAKDIYNICCPEGIEDENVYLNIIQIAILKDNQQNVKYLLLGREEEEGMGGTVPFDMKSLLFYTLSYGTLNMFHFICKNMFFGIDKNEMIRIPLIDMLYHLEKHNNRGWWNTRDDSDLIKAFLVKFQKHACFCVNQDVCAIYNSSDLVNILYAFSTTIFETEDEFKRNFVKRFHKKFSKDTLAKLINRGV